MVGIRILKWQHTLLRRIHAHTPPSQQKKINHVHITTKTRRGEETLCEGQQPVHETKRPMQRQQNNTHILDTKRIPQDGRSNYGEKKPDTRAMERDMNITTSIQPPTETLQIPQTPPPTCGADTPICANNQSNHMNSRSSRKSHSSNTYPRQTKEGELNHSQKSTNSDGNRVSWLQPLLSVRAHHSPGKSPPSARSCGHPPKQKQQANDRLIPKKLKIHHAKLIVSGTVPAGEDQRGAAEKYLIQQAKIREVQNQISSAKRAKRVERRANKAKRKRERKANRIAKAEKASKQKMGISIGE